MSFGIGTGGGYWRLSGVTGDVGAGGEMYSAPWFDLFADGTPAAITAGDVAAVVRHCPPLVFPALLEVGCGNGRVSSPLSAAGFDVTGIDVNQAALAIARMRSPNVNYVLLDQRRVDELEQTFDCAIILWNSIGFTTRDDDMTTLTAISRVLRTGGKLLIDLYHPDWLRAQSAGVTTDSRGAQVRRWVEDARCFHEIVYADGGTDHIQFNVYQPAEMIAMAMECGFDLTSQMTWWRRDSRPSAECARYQLEFAKRGGETGGVE